jgi:hypothetical protein
MAKGRAEQSSPGPGSTSVAQQTHTHRERVCVCFGIPPSVLTHPWFLQYFFALGIDTCGASKQTSKQASKFYTS